MKVICPGCGWSAEVPEDKITDEGITATCRKCQVKFEVKKELKPAVEQVAVTPSPTPAVENMESRKANTKAVAMENDEKFKLTKLELAGLAVFVLMLLQNVGTGNILWSVFLIVAFGIAVFAKRKLISDYSKKPSVAIAISTVLFVIIAAVGGSVIPKAEKATPQSPSPTAAVTPPAPSPPPAPPAKSGEKVAIETMPTEIAAKVIALAKSKDSDPRIQDYLINNQIIAYNAVQSHIAAAKPNTTYSKVLSSIAAKYPYDYPTQKAQIESYNKIIEYYSSTLSEALVAAIKSSANSDHPNDYVAQFSAIQARVKNAANNPEIQKSERQGKAEREDVARKTKELREENARYETERARERKKIVGE